MTIRLLFFILIIIQMHAICTPERCCLASPCSSTYCSQKNSETWVSTENYANYQYTKLAFSNNSCLPCSYDCQTCTSESICSTCASDFYMDSISSHCLLCSYKCKNCIVKNSITKCSACGDGTYLDSSASTCKDCPTGAQLCSSSTVISQCLSGYYKSSNSMFCVACPNNCVSCPSSNQICSSCASGYYLLNSQCNPCTLSNCQTCAYISSKQACSLCSSGYRLLSGNCTSCTSFCASCSSSACTTCNTGYYLVSGGCLTITSTVENCQLYSSGTACSKCSNGFYLKNNQCYPCSLLCTTCIGDHFGLCSLCNSNSKLFNQMCLLNSFPSPNSYQLYMSFPASSYLASAGSTDCNKWLLSGSSISLNLNNLKSSKISLQWKIFSKGGSTNYKVGISNSANTVEFTYMTSSSAGQAFAYCSSNTSLLYYYSSQVQNFSSLLLSNTLYFSTNNQVLLALQEVVITLQKCNSLCIQCSDILCTQCQMNNLYTQDAYCVYTCATGYYIYLNTSNPNNTNMCLQNCPIATYALSTNLSCASCVSPCYSCQNDVFCISCIVNYFLASDNTCQQVCPYKYFGDIQSQTCQMCVGRCRECLDIQKCLSCNSGFLYTQNNSCLDSCGQSIGIIGMFADLLTLSCQPCSSSCLNCELTSTFCTNCAVGKVFFNNTCLTTCPFTFYSDSNSICQKCSYPCQNCQNSSQKCLSCLDGYLLNSTCLADCPSGYFENNIGLQCSLCGIGCSSCYGSSSNCLSCGMGYFLYLNICNSTCPVGYFPNATTLLCISCINLCYHCINQTYCLSCKSNFLSIQGTCVAANLCPSHQFADINSLSCLACTLPCLQCQFSSNYCTACQPFNQSTLYLLDNNNCVNQCSSSLFYASSNLAIPTCVSCQTPCLTCLNAVTCLSCISGYMLANGKCSTICIFGTYYNSTLNTCESCQNNCLSCTSSIFCQICVNNFYLNSLTSIQNQCVVTCPTTSYGSITSKSCQSCIYPCQTCTSQIDCLSCQSGIIYQLRCISSCPDSTFYQNTTQLCQPCGGNCLTCAFNPTNCISCILNNYLDTAGMTCSLTCPTSNYAEVVTQLCLACPQSCSLCLNSTYCTACIANQTYLNVQSHSCLESCPLGSYGSSSTQNCEICAAKCLSCLTVPTNCITCASNYLIVRITVNSLDCALACPVGYYSQNQNCYQCIFPCNTCSSSVTCLTCVLGTYYYQPTHSCLLSCPPNSYINYTAITCSSCAFPCSSCINTTVCLSCQNSLYLWLGQCISICPSGYYSDESLICQQCYGLCKTCSSKYFCLSCLTGYLSDGYCYSSCSAGTFANTSVSICESCMSPCLECSFESKYCTKCVNSGLSYLGNCSSTCPFGTYQSDSSCLLCIFPCVQCNDPYSCNQCLGGYLLYMNLTCIQDAQFCPNDFFKMDGKYCISMNSCPSTYLIDIELKTCGSTCSRSKYTNTDTRRCVDSCRSDQYVGENLICYNFTSNPPISLMGMSAIAYIQSSKMRLDVSFNQSVVWLNSNPQIYTFTRITSRLLLTTLPYTLQTHSPTQIYFNGQVLPKKINLNLPAFNVKSAITNYSLQTANTTVQLPSFTTYSSSQIYQGKIASQYGQGVSWFILLLSLFFLLKNRLSDLYILWDTAQLLYCLLFLAIQLPPNLTQFLKGLGDTHFTAFPNIFPYPTTRMNSDLPFYGYSYDNNFLRNAGSSLTLIVIAMSIFIIFKVLELLMRKVEKFKQLAEEYPKVKKMIYSIILRYRWHHISDMFFLTYLTVFLFAAAEVYHISQNSNNIFSNVACILSILIFIIFPIFVAFKLHKHFPNIYKGKMVQNLRCFYRGIQKTNKFGVFLIIIRYFRKLVYSLIIAIFSSKPMYAVPILMFTSVLLGLFIFINLPFQKRFSNIVEMISEISLALLYLAIAFINFNNQNNNSDVNMLIGWICCGLLTLMMFLLVLEVFCKSLFNLESETPKKTTHLNANQTDPKLLEMDDAELRRKAGEFFDYIFPQIKKDFNFGDDSEDDLHSYEDGDSQNSQNNNERAKQWGIRDEEEKDSDQFRHYDNNSQSEEHTHPKTANQVPAYLIRCVKELK